jgi:hypothetical protein
MMCTDFGQPVAVSLQPFPHTVDIVDAKITGQNERVQIVLTHHFPCLSAAAVAVSAV